MGLTILSNYQCENKIKLEVVEDVIKLKINAAKNRVLLTKARRKKAFE